MDQDGWFKAKGGDLSAPLPMPKKGKAVTLRQVRRFQNAAFRRAMEFFNPGRTR
jgi:xylan 1,4-beta-xylosidase